MHGRASSQSLCGPRTNEKASLFPALLFNRRGMACVEGMVLQRRQGDHCTVALDGAR